MSEVTGIIFDVDGTLVDSNDQHAMAWYDAFQAAGREVPFDSIRRLIGKGSDKLLRELTGLDIDSPEGKALSEECKHIFQDRYLQQVRPFPKSAELVSRLRELGFKLSVASSARRSDLEALLAIAGAPDLLDHSADSKDAAKSKPNPDIVAVALEKLGVPAEQAMMIGDTPYDVEAGTRAGVGVIALRCGGWQDNELKGAKAVYQDPADLLARLADSPIIRA
jgi:HAD superfamily hydrolase (TIGR01509 family)